MFTTKKSRQNCRLKGKDSRHLNPNRSLDHKSSKLLVFVLFPNRFYFLVGILPVFVT